MMLTLSSVRGPWRRLAGAGVLMLVLPLAQAATYEVTVLDDAVAADGDCTLREALDNIVDIIWERIDQAGARGRTVTLKLKHVDFTLHTRAKSLPRAVADKAEFARLGHALLDEVLPLPQPVRLIWGVGGATQEALDRAGIRSFADLRRWTLPDLTHRFGAMGERLFHLSRGEDRRG